jgi:hypothetical protein
MTTKLDTQFDQPSFDALQRYLDFEAKLTPVGINRLVKSGAMAPARGATMKEAGRRWKALSSDERTPYVAAAYQHNAKMADMADLFAEETI